MRLQWLSQVVLYFFPESLYICFEFAGGSVSKESTCNTGDKGLIPGVGRSPGEGNSNSLSFPRESHYTEEPGRPQDMRLQELDTT